MTTPLADRVEGDVEPTRREQGGARALATRIEQFMACCWETASLGRQEIRDVYAYSGDHGSAPITVTSCQRIEVYSTNACDCGAPLQRQGVAALRHLAEVAAGLHSVVLGEAQILGQVRTAIQKAPADVKPLAETALAAARELRRETDFHSHSGHLLDRALARAELVAKGRLLVVGAGAVGRLIAQRGRELGFDDVVIASRREPEGAWFHEGGFAYAPLWSIREVDAVDVAVGCLGSEADELRLNENLPEIRSLIVDLGTPRNFAPTADVPLVTIASMIGQGNERPHSDGRRSALRKRLHTILDRRVAMASHDAQSPIGHLRHAVEQARQQELARIQAKHPDLAPETIDAITRSLVNKIFHAPSKRLKQLDNEELARRLAELFVDDAEPDVSDGDGSTGDDLEHNA